MEAPGPACRLYLITPATIADPEAFARILEEAMGDGDVAALQVRLKDTGDAEIAAVVQAVKPVAHARGAALLLNDRPDLASALDCDGVHIGQSDGTVAAARAMVGAGRIVGVTCHASRDLAMTAAEQGADYVAFGAFFPTTTKPTIHRPELEILEIWQETMLTPCVAIGGITAANCAPLVRAGADFLAVCSAVWDHPRGPGTAVAELTRAIAGARLASPSPTH